MGHSEWSVGHRGAVNPADRLLRCVAHPPTRLSMHGFGNAPLRCFALKIVINDWFSFDDRTVAGQCSVQPVSEHLVGVLAGHA